MNMQTSLLLVATVGALLVGVFAVWRNRHAWTSYALCAGMVLLAAEQAFAGLGGYALLPEAIIGWHRARLLTMAFLPAVWLTFSLVYARANGREALRRWANTVVVLAVVPVVVAVLGWRSLVAGCLRRDRDSRSGWRNWGYRARVCTW